MALPIPLLPPVTMATWPSRLIAPASVDSVSVGTGRSCLDGDPSGAVVELVIEVDGGVDQGEMREGLGEVAQLFAGCADLLCEQSEVVGVRQHLLEGEARVLQPARAREGVDVPEGAQREGSL